MSELVELTSENTDEVMELYQDHKNWRKRSKNNVRKALENTDLGLGLRDNGELVASARVMTDFVYYAKVYDVIVDIERRNEGFGKELMNSIPKHDAFDDMPRPHLELVCREGLIPFYESCGFEVFDNTVEKDGQEQEYIKMNYSWNE